MRAVISSEKHLIYQGNIPNGDGKGEPSENAELFLEALKFRFRSIKKRSFCRTSDRSFGVSRAQSM